MTGLGLEHRHRDWLRNLRSEGAQGLFYPPAFRVRIGFGPAGMGANQGRQVGPGGNPGRLEVLVNRGQQIGQGPTVLGEADQVQGVRVGPVGEDAGQLPGPREVGPFQTEGDRGFSGEKSIGSGGIGIVFSNRGKHSGISEVLQQIRRKRQIDGKDQDAVRQPGRDGEPGVAQRIQSAGASVGEDLPGTPDAEIQADGGRDFAVKRVAGRELPEGSAKGERIPPFALIGPAGAGVDPRFAKFAAGPTGSFDARLRCPDQEIGSGAGAPPFEECPICDPGRGKMTERGRRSWEFPEKFQGGLSSEQGLGVLLTSHSESGNDARCSDGYGMDQARGE